MYTRDKQGGEGCAMHAEVCQVRQTRVCVCVCYLCVPRHVRCCDHDRALHLVRCTHTHTHNMGTHTHTHTHTKRVVALQLASHSRGVIHTHTHTHTHVFFGQQYRIKHAGCGGEARHLTRPPPHTHTERERETRTHTYHVCVCV